MNGLEAMYNLILIVSPLQVWPEIRCGYVKTTYDMPPNKSYFLHFSSKTYDVGTKKNRLNEAILLSTQTNV